MYVVEAGCSGLTNRIRLLYLLTYEILKTHFVMGGKFL